MSALSSFPENGATQLLPQIDWHQHGHTGHTVQFYAADSFLIDPLARLIGGTLAAGESAVVIASEEHRRQLLESIVNRRVDLSRALREGRFLPLDAARTLDKFMDQGRPDPVRFAEVIGGVLGQAKAAAAHGRITAFGEMVALLWADGNRDAALELEQLWNDLASRYSFSLHCAYPLSEFRCADDAQFFQKICSQHSGVIPAESYTALADDAERLRNIAELQQKAQALEFERKQHASLRTTNLQLEAKAAAHQDELRKLGASEEGLRQLSARLLRTHDEERRRLGLNLHDSVGQYLAVLKMALEMLGAPNAPSGDVAKQLMTQCLPLLEHSIRELRAASYLLYPPMIDETGLRTAIQWYLDGFIRNSGIPVALEVSSPLGRLPSEIELAIFRVLQESLANVHQHSQSSTAAVALGLVDGMVRLEVRDNGKGIPQELLASCNGSPGKLGVGLRAMEERVRQLGGQLRLSSSSVGTTLIASVPLSA